jgi:hypothetical protein
MAEPPGCFFLFYHSGRVIATRFSFTFAGENSMIRKMLRR